LDKPWLIIVPLFSLKLFGSPHGYPANSRGVAMPPVEIEIGIGIAIAIAIAIAIGIAIGISIKTDFDTDTDTDRRHLAPCHSHASGNPFFFFFFVILNSSLILNSGFLIRHLPVNQSTSQPVN